MSSNANIHVQEVVQRVHEELRQLMRQRVLITRQIGTVKQTIVGLANLFGDDVLNDDLLELVDRKSKRRQPGLTKACRRILMEASKAMSARDVCDQIQQTMPLLLAGNRYPMAAITTVLTRLVRYEEARAETGDGGRRGFQWAADGDSPLIDAAGAASRAQV